MTRIERLRRERDFTRPRLSELSSVTVRTIQNVERKGTRTQARIQRLLASALGVDVADLFTKKGVAK